MCITTLFENFIRSVYEGLRPGKSRGRRIGSAGKAGGAEENFPRHLHHRGLTAADSAHTALTNFLRRSAAGHRPN